MTRIIAAALAAFLATPAAAQEGCPTAADLETGIRVAFQDGAEEVYRRTSWPGVVRVEGSKPDGTSYRMELAQGVHLLFWEAGGDKSTRAAYDYGAAPDTLPVPVAGGRWSPSVTRTDSAGAVPEPQLQVWGTQGAVSIGSCRYDAIEVAIAYVKADSDAPAYTEGVRYIPALGFGVLAWQLWEGEPRVDYVQVSIAAEP